MLIANNEIKQRIVPFKGGRAFCPFCNETVIAVCGEINIHHWRHDINSKCDPWKESETDWHRTWKEKFPIEWREFIITKYGEKHIADIRTDSGLIVEFQNSSISSTTIKVRETFYENMIWLINAEIFKDNFSIRSIVRTRLRNLESKYNDDLNDSYDIEEYLTGYLEEIKRIGKIIENLQYDIDSIQSKIHKHEDFVEEFDDSFKSFIESNYYSYSLNGFESELIKNIKELDKNIKEIENDIKVQENKYKLINSFPVARLENYKTYREVAFSKISPSFFSLCKVIKKETLNTFFPDVKDINSEFEFARFSYEKDKYLLIVDLSKNLQFVSDNISNLNAQKDSIKIQKGVNIQLLANEIRNWINEKIESEKEQLEKIQKEKTDKIKDQKEIDIKMEIERKSLQAESKVFREKLKSDKATKEIEIKKTLKGYYTYNWKYRRKTWDYATKPIFLDFDSHIFQIISDEKLQKLSTDEFIKTIKNWR